ncbi:VOC family protein [Methylococcus sp. EFPC2]|uniref:VOC family protein n=1 Tax=Methylococcus sp. EFPC2 TaxID=2812648 RepID=UPI00196721F6|nr:VOC family protein [Methylococcus sp. EFPC2]QSA97899.1 VOC family protein [Methylococcus sp. EFPC2]
MSDLAKNTKATVIPCLRYRDVPAAITWLCSAFGFEKQAVHTNADGSIAHAQLTFGNGMVMLGLARETEGEWGRLIRQPDEIGNAETQTPYVVVTDVDALYARARATGAGIVVDIEDRDYGGRDFTCRDPEGHLWVFGNYDPW